MTEINIWTNNSASMCLGMLSTSFSHCCWRLVQKLCGMKRCTAGEKRISLELGKIIRAEGSKYSSRIIFAWFVHPLQRHICLIPALLKPRSSLILHQISLWYVGLSSLQLLDDQVLNKAENPYGLFQTSVWLFFSCHWWWAFSSFAWLQPCP